MSNLWAMQARSFLTAVLGDDGFEALNKAAQRLPELEAVFVPRTVIAWLDCAARVGFEGQVPGTSVALTKGELVVDGRSYALAGQEAAAALMINLMDDVSIPEELDPKMVARLAKSVETLTKQRFLAMIKALEDAAEVSPGEATGSPETTESAESADTRDTMIDLGKGIEDMTKGTGWKSTDGLTIPKGRGPDRQAWDEKYKQAVADRFAGGDVSKLVPVQVPVTEHAHTHYVPTPGSSGAKLQPRYRVPMYQKMLGAGDQLPPVFAEEPRPGVFKIIDGNARLMAALLHGKTTHLPGFTLKKGEVVRIHKPSEHYKKVKACETSGKHLSSTDGDGYCNHCGYQETAQELAHADREKLGKGIEEPGKAAKPRAPVKPDAPDPAMKAPGTGAGQAKPAQPVGFPKGPGVPAAPAVPTIPQVKAPQVTRARGFYKSELVKACGRCQETQMRGRQVVGCLCITDVVMGAELVQKNEGDKITISGPDAVILVIEERLGLSPGA